VFVCDWVHKPSNVLAALPKSAHPGPKAALGEVYNAENKRRAHAAAKRFEPPLALLWRSR
jgi:hypothetical protein